MKFFTLNTWQERGPWKDRWEAVFDALAELKPDVVAFQEVFNPDWAEEVRRRAGFSEIVYLEKKSGLMMLSRYPVKNKESLPMKTVSPTEPYSRYALFAEIEMGGESLAVFNTHLSWRPHEGPIRKLQAQELVSFIEDYAAKKDVIAAGDFNAAPETGEIAILLDNKLTDSFASLHPNEPGYTWDNVNPYAHSSSELMPDRRIDYVFYRSSSGVLGPLVSAEVILSKAAANGIYASDHYGLFAEWAPAK